MKRENLIQTLIHHIALHSDKADNKSCAQLKGIDTYLYADYNSVYGGYNLVEVHVERGTHFGTFDGSGCDARMKYNVFIIYLRALLAGLKHNSK